MKKCFVIQPFDGDTFDKRYETVFEPSIKEAGVEPYRVDLDSSVSIPINEIETGIRESEICFAEITTDNPNVWFELGYAIAMTKKVVLVCSEKRKSNFPFDVQHRNIITYKTDSPQDFDKLKESITKQIQGILKKQDDLRKLAPTTLFKDSHTISIENEVHEIEMAKRKIKTAINSNSSNINLMTCEEGSTDKACPVKWLALLNIAEKQRILITLRKLMKFLMGIDRIFYDAHALFSLLQDEPKQNIPTLLFENWFDISQSVSDLFKLFECPEIEPSYEENYSGYQRYKQYAKYPTQFEPSRRIFEFLRLRLPPDIHEHRIEAFVDCLVEFNKITEQYREHKSDQTIFSNPNIASNIHHHLNNFQRIYSNIEYAIKNVLTDLFNKTGIQIIKEFENTNDEYLHTILKSLNINLPQNSKPNLFVWPKDFRNGSKKT